MSFQDRGVAACEKTVFVLLRTALLLQAVGSSAKADALQAAWGSLAEEYEVWSQSSQGRGQSLFDVAEKYNMPDCGYAIQTLMRKSGSAKPNELVESRKKTALDTRKLVEFIQDACCGRNASADSDTVLNFIAERLQGVNANLRLLVEGDWLSSNSQAVKWVQQWFDKAAVGTLSATDFPLLSKNLYCVIEKLDELIFSA